MRGEREKGVREEKEEKGREKEKVERQGTSKCY